MSLRASTLVFCSVLCAARAADAAIIVFTDRTIFFEFGTAIEDFNAYDGPYGGTLAGSVGGIAWTASSSGGVEVISGRLSSGSSAPLSISFGPTLGCGGNFFGTDGSGTAVPSLVLVSLSDGTSYLNLVDSDSAWVGFVSTGASITGIEISTISLPGSPPPAVPTIDNLELIVPAPGAIALFGMLGLASRRRR